MEKTYYQNGEYRCPRCGAVMVPSGGKNEWECTECDILGTETWDEDTKTGYVTVDVEAYEEYLEESRKEDEARFRDQIAEYESDMLRNQPIEE